MNSFENLMEAIDFLPTNTNSREYTGSPESQGVSGTERTQHRLFCGEFICETFSLLGKPQPTSLLMCVL